MTIKLRTAKNESLKCCFCEKRIIRGKPYYDSGNGKRGIVYCKPCRGILERMKKMAPILDELDRRAS